MKYPFIGFLFIAYLCVSSPIKLTAQVMRLYTTQHGLITNNCYNVDIDSRGFAWVAGMNTLGLFDGTKFQYLPTTTQDGRQLFQMSHCVQEEGDDKFWVCTTHGLFLLNARTMHFEHIFLNEQEDSIYGYSSNRIIDYPKEHYKLVTTDGFDSYLINTKTLKVDQGLTKKLNKALEESFITSPVIDKHQRLWTIGRTTKLTCIDLKDFKHHTIHYTPEAATIAERSTITCLMEIGQELFIGTNHGLLIYNQEDDLVREPEVYTGNLFVSSILYTHDNRILLGTDGHGIWEYKNTGEIDALGALEKTSDFDISYGKVMDMKEDRKGNIIATFLHKGLVIIPSQNTNFHYYPISPQNNQNNATSITSMTTDGQKNYWVGTDGCGVFTTEGAHLETAYPVNNGLNSLLIQDVKIDKHGTVWVGTYGGGVQWLENGKWVHRGLEEISQEMVMTMCYNTEEDKLLIGTNGHGIICINMNDHSLSRLTFPFAYNQWVSSLLQDTQGTLWVGSSTGVFSYNATNGRHREININGHRICNSNAIQQDGDNILIASEDGLVIYNIKTQKQVIIGEEQGLTCPVINAITTTDTHIWLATSHHIASVNKKSHEVRNYSSFNGYQIGEFHRNSFVQPGNGDILFGGDNGIIGFTPKLITQRSTQVEPVYFTNFTTPLNTERMDASIFYAKEIWLEHDNATFDIEFSSVELGDPQRIHYEYLLEGFEEQWHSNGVASHAQFSTLSPGTYILRVRAYQEDNPTEFSENSITIHVAAPWYATIWAFLIYAFILIAIAYLIYHQIQWRKKQKELHRHTEEQKRIKEEKLNLFTSITNELRSPLTMIESPLKQLQTEDQDPNHQDLFRAMRRNCNRLLDITNLITDHQKAELGQVVVHLEEHDYVAYTNPIFEQFQGKAKMKEISFDIEHTQTELPMMMDITHFKKIITNLLNYAFEFTNQGGRVIVKSGIEENKVVLHFYHSGAHLAADELQHLWKQFYQGITDTNHPDTGLNFVHQLVELHHGIVEVKNIEPIGVEFVLSFPNFHEPQTASEDGRATLLLVDDDLEFATFMGDLLGKDYNIITAYSGNSAWKKVLTHRPDVVITDYHMPDGNGIELCQQIKSNLETESIPVLLLTGEGDETLHLQSLNMQVEHYMEKPVNMAILHAAIEQVLHVRQTLRNKANRNETAVDMPKLELENLQERLFDRVKEIIKKHLDESDFSVQQLSEEVGISRVHLNRKMKNHYGVSPNTFIRSFRLKQAAYLLANNKANVNEVAYAVGFSSHSYFTTSFREYFGMSPKEFIAFYSKEENGDALQRLLD